MSVHDDDKKHALDAESAEPEAGAAEERSLEQQLVEKSAEAERFHDLYLRERAELENFKKRMQRDKAEALRFANEPLIRDLLPVIDDLERAVEHAEGGGNGQPLVEGVRLVLRRALETLERHGVTRVKALGERFDPNRHEALAQIPGGKGAENQVVEQFAAGYLLHDRLLRAAQVSVSKGEPVENQGDDD
jgi:molecular chaperone GrpE